MTDIRDRYPARSFLLQKERRFLVRRADGAFDPTALRNAHTQLAFAPVDADVRTRLQKSVARLLCVGDAVKKGAWSYGDMEQAGRLNNAFGFPIVIEVPDGGTRSGTSKDGTKWETKLDGMSYGFLPDTIAADAEELDVIVGKDITAPMAFVIDQGDECKLALGYANAQDARGVYEKNWTAGMLKEMYEIPMEVVRALLGASPASLAKSIYAAKRMSGMSAGTVIMSNGEVIGAIKKNVGQDNRTDSASMSMEQLRDLALKPLRARLVPDVPASTPAYQVDIWIVDTYDDILVYSYQNELWRIGYALVGSDVSLVGDPVRVKRTYEDVAKSAMVQPVNKARKPEVLVEIATSWQGAEQLKPLLENIHKLGAPKHSFGIIADETTTGGSLECKSGAKVRLGSWDGDGAAWMEIHQIRKLDDESTKSAMNVGMFAGGGAKLPGQAQAQNNEDERSAQFKSRVWNAFTFLDPKRMSLTSDERVEKTVDEKPMTVWGVVLESEPNDGAGDLHRETYGPEFVINTAYDFNAWYMNLDDQHGEFIPPNRAVIIESYVTKQAEQWGARTVKPITWIMGVRIYCPELKKQILSGAKTGLSIEGFAERVPNTAAA